MRPIWPPLALTVVSLLVPATAARAARARPDLRETAVTLSATSVAPGGALTVSDTVVNAGRATAARSRLGYDLSRDRRRDAADASLARRAVNALKPRRRSRGRRLVRIPAGAAPGSYFLLVCADVRSRVKETNERNNCRAAALSVVAGAGSGGSVGGSQGPQAGGQSTGGGGPPGGGGTQAEVCGDAVDNDGDGSTNEGCFAGFYFEREHTSGTLTFGPPACTDTTVPEAAHVGVDYHVAIYATDPYCARTPFDLDTTVAVSSDNPGVAAPSSGSATFLAGQSAVTIMINPISPGDATFHVTYQTLDQTFSVHVSP